MNLDTTPIGPERKYFAFLAQGRFMIQRPRSAGEYFYLLIAMPGARQVEGGEVALAQRVVLSSQGTIIEVGSDSTL